MNPAIQTKLEKFFKPPEVEEIRSFLDREFSPNGEIVIASIFISARNYGKSVDEVLKAFEREWRTNWVSQPPDLRGNPDAEGPTGRQNKVSLNIIYDALEIPSPAEDKQKNIPQGSFKVRTLKAVYQFGPAKPDGERTISREGKPFNFTRCRIYFLSQGASMVLEVLDGPKPGLVLRTSSVQSIEEL